MSVANVASRQFQESSSRGEERLALLRCGRSSTSGYARAIEVKRCVYVNGRVASGAGGFSPALAFAVCETAVLRGSVVMCGRPASSVQPLEYRRPSDPEGTWSATRVWLCAPDRAKALELGRWVSRGWQWRLKQPARSLRPAGDDNAARVPMRAWEFPSGYIPKLPGAPIPEMGYRSPRIRRSPTNPVPPRTVEFGSGFPEEPPRRPRRRSV